MTRAVAIGAEDRLAALGVVLPEPPPPAGLYCGAKRTGRTVHVSGHVAMGFDPSIPVIGRVGAELTVAQGREAARLTTLNMLASLRAEIGSLDRVAEVVKVLGYIKCADGFNRTPEVINGCSALLLEVFGEAGRHARSAIGVAELPFGHAVELEMIVELDGEN